MTLPEPEWRERPLPLEGRKIWVAGHRGMVGSALLRALDGQNANILTVSHEDLDLRRQAEVEAWMLSERPDIVILAAAKVGGILANERSPADFFYDNMMISANVLHAAASVGVEKLVCLGSSCIYPRHAPQPIPESALLSGPLEPTNEAYALAKIAAVRMCQYYRRQRGCNFISVMPCNLYGPNDRYDPESSHVIPALFCKFRDAIESAQSSVEIWGTGTPKREFLYVDDLAEAVLHLLTRYEGEMPVNAGSGTDISIKELAELLRQTTGYEGALQFNPEKPDGTPKKRMDSSRLFESGWRPRTDLETGLRRTWQDFLKRFPRS